MSVDRIHMQHPVVQDFIAFSGERMVFCRGRFYQWRVKQLLNPIDNDPHLFLVQRYFFERLQVRYEELELNHGLLPDNARHVLMALVTAIQQARREWEEDIAIN